MLKFKNYIKSFVCIILILTLLPITSLTTYGGSDEAPGTVYGHVYMNENMEVKVIQGEKAKLEYLDAQEENNAQKPLIQGIAAGAPAYDILELTSKDKVYNTNNIANVYEAAEYCLLNVLKGTYSVGFTVEKALTKSQITSLYHCVYTYFPHYFSIVYMYNGTNYSIEFVIDQAKITDERNFAATKINEIISGKTTEYDKIKAINDWIVANNTYNLNAPDKGQHAYNVFVNNNSVCAGYANAFTLLCYYAGINVVGISGNAGGAHRWNVVLCEDKTKRLVDVTWNDPDTANNLSNYDYFWKTDLTTASYGSMKKRTWDSAQNTFIAYVNETDGFTADIDSPNKEVSKNNELTLWAGGGNAVTPLGGSYNTASVQLTAYEDYGVGTILAYDYAKAKTRAWAVTLSPDVKPLLNGSSYLSDKTVITAANGKVTAVDKGEAYLWYIAKDATGEWFDSMSEPIKITVKRAANTIYLSSNNIYDAANGVSPTIKPVTTGTVKKDNTVTLYLNAFFKKGKIISPADSDTTYTLSFVKPADVQYANFLVNGTATSATSVIVNSSSLGSAGIQVKGVDTTYKKVNNVMTAKDVKVTINVTCNQSGKSAKFTLTVTP